MSRFTKQPEVKLTDSGRQVFGGGGITPDIVVEPPKPDDFQELLARRGIFFPFEGGVGDFTRYFLGTRPDIPAGWHPTDATIQAFQQYLDKEKIPYTQDDIAKNLDWLKWKIQAEVYTSIFGLTDGYKVALERDPQLDKAVESIPQARALYENARKILAERQSPAPVHP
jgi:carboxyl-terminal processing protease